MEFFPYYEDGQSGKLNAGGNILIDPVNLFNNNGNCLVKNYTRRILKLME